MCRIVSLSVIIIFFFASSLTVLANRSIVLVSDLDHKSGKLGEYHALVIGIQNYKDKSIPNLETPRKDATEMTKLLKEKYGFSVKTLYDSQATKKALYNELRVLSRNAEKDDSVLIYFAGHGDLDKTYDSGWWIPYDAKGGDSFTYLDNSEVQKAMRAIKAKHVLLISDSCYSGTLFGNTRSIPKVITERYYLELYNEKSRWGLTSGNRTPVSDTGTDGHSVFAYHLLKELRKNKSKYISTQEICTSIAPIIANSSEQTPMCRPVRNTGDQGGSFVFVLLDSGYKSGLQSPSIPDPENDKASFEDILGIAREKEEKKKKWDKWQSDREAEFIQVKGIDQNNNIEAEHKVEAWNRFLKVFNQNNPFSKRDDEIVQYASDRLAYWKRNKNDEKKSYYSIKRPGSKLVSKTKHSNAPVLLKMGTGGVTGVYYPTGGAIGRLVNKGKREHGVRFSVQSTGGSVYNLNALAAKELDFGVAQSDWHYHAYYGTSKFSSKGANKNLRSVFSVHPEPFTVIARADSGIKYFEDLKGKRVNIGNPGSGQRGVMELLMDRYGWSKSSFRRVSELSWSYQAEALCDDKVDAIIFTIGHPSGSIKQVTSMCDSVIVDVSGREIDQLISEYSYYRKATIPGRMYKGTPYDVDTFGVGATVVTSADVPESAVYSVAQSVFENFDQFKKLHPAFSYLKKDEMVRDSLTAPLHIGAAKYYHDSGLISYSELRLAKRYASDYVRKNNNDYTYLTMGTGGVTGVYYPTGGAIGRLVNKGKQRHGTLFSVESTGGSVYNLNAIAAGELDIGMAQSDWQFHAYNGTGKFESKGANKDLRTLFSVHAEPFTVVARRDSGIRKFRDLKGKRVNIGNPGSGQRGTMSVVMDAMGWSRRTFSKVTEYRSSKQANALCNDEVDAIVYTVGHPSGSIKEVTYGCDAVIVEVDGPVIDSLIKRNSYYRKAVIPGGMYPGNPKDIDTFGVGATVVTSSKVPDELIYNVVDSVFENFHYFKKLHPAFTNLKKEEMVRASLTAPLHDGALKYYRENGLLH